jgi:hypothetical protein
MNLNNGYSENVAFAELPNNTAATIIFDLKKRS